MSTTFTWSITHLMCKPELAAKQNVVIQIEWMCKARADINGKVFTQETMGTSSPGQFDPHGTFIPFNALTEEDVYRWATSDGLNKKAVEERLQMLLDEQINPPVVSLMPPWLVARV